MSQPTEFRWKFAMTKEARHMLQEPVIKRNGTELMASVNSRQFAAKGWSLELDTTTAYGGKFFTFRHSWGSGLGGYIYSMNGILKFEKDGQKPKDHDRDAVLLALYRRGLSQGFGKWTLTEFDGAPYEKPGSKEEMDLSNLGYADVEIPADWDTHFEHLFGLDSHIARIRRAIEAGIASRWQNRYHCALVGPPGCGKSDICQSIKRAFGDSDAVVELDATSTTAAGAQKLLADRTVLPRIILIEEIEKAPEQAMTFLLSVLDLRGQIKRVTARDTVERDTKLFAIATVNNVPLFRSLQAGALASRFSNTIWFHRPNREQLSMILAREIDGLGEAGDHRWIEPTLDYCEEIGESDPRAVAALCLCGRDMLLTGEYQTMLNETSEDTLSSADKRAIDKAATPGRKITKLPPAGRTGASHGTRRVTRRRVV